MLGTMPDYGVARLLATTPTKVAARIFSHCDEGHGLLMQGIDLVYLQLQEEDKGSNFRELVLVALKGCPWRECVCATIKVLCWQAGGTLTLVKREPGFE